MRKISVPILVILGLTITLTNASVLKQKAAFGKLHNLVEAKGKSQCRCPDNSVSNLNDQQSIEDWVNNFHCSCEDGAPTAAPTLPPSEETSAAPTTDACEIPTEAPTLPPSESTSAAPTTNGCEVPTDAPTEAPTLPPSEDTSAASTEQCGCTDAPVTTIAECTIVETTEAPTEAPTLPPSENTSAASSESCGCTDAPATTIAECTIVETTEAPTEAPTLPPSENTSAASSESCGCTDAPTEAPTLPPSESTSAAPTTNGCEVPTDAPTLPPSENTSAASSESCGCTDAPTEAPTLPPSESTSAAPTSNGCEVPTDAPTLPPSENTSAASSEACGCSDVPTEAPTLPPSEDTSAAPTTNGCEVPTEAPTAAPSQCPAEECTADNTPNWQYNSVQDCNWVYNASSATYWDCVKQDCTWQFNTSDCQWSCVNNIPPSENSTCTFTCEQFRALEQRVATLEAAVFGVMSGLKEDNGAAVDQEAALYWLQQQINLMSESVIDVYGQLKGLGDDIDAVDARLDDIEAHDYVKDVRQDIQAHGMYFGDRWWVGQQNDNLYVIDTIDASWYTFQHGMNATL